MSFALPVLGVIFITLKLCHVIAWSWWLVLAPFEVIFAARLVIWLLALAVCLSETPLQRALRRLGEALERSR